MLPPCDICRMTNHTTQNCRFQGNLSTNGFTATSNANTNAPGLSNNYQRSPINHNRRPPTTSEYKSNSRNNILPPCDICRMTNHTTQGCRFQANLSTNGFTFPGNINTNAPGTSNNYQISPIHHNRRPHTSGHLYISRDNMSPPCDTVRMTNHTTQDYRFKRTFKGKCYGCQCVGHKQFECRNVNL